MNLQVEKKTELLVKEIQNSKNLTADEKGDMQDILLHASEGTNGLTPEEKLQNATESIFSLVCLMVSQRLDGSGRLAGLYKVLIECKWAIVTLGGLICGLLAYRPEVSAVIKEFVK